MSLVVHNSYNPMEEIISEKNDQIVFDSCVFSQGEWAMKPLTRVAFNKCLFKNGAVLTFSSQCSMWFMECTFVEGSRIMFFDHCEKLVIDRCSLPCPGVFLGNPTTSLEFVRLDPSQGLDLIPPTEDCWLILRDGALNREAGFWDLERPLELKNRKMVLYSNYGRCRSIEHLTTSLYRYPGLHVQYILFYEENADQIYTAKFRREITMVLLLLQKKMLPAELIRECCYYLF